jgi:hypothetical protein
MLPTLMATGRSDDSVGLVTFIAFFLIGVIIDLLRDRHKTRYQPLRGKGLGGKPHEKR